MWPLLLVSSFLPSALIASTPFPAGALDPSGKVAYLASGPGVDAVDLATGGLLWRSTEAQVPLLVADGRLYALGYHPTNKLSAITFDLAAKGERIYRTDLTDLPRWVSTRPSATQSFQIDWSRHADEVVLDWRAEARADAGPAKRADGQLRLDLEHGRIRSVPAERTPPKPERMPILFEKHNLRWHGRAGGQLVAVVQEGVPGSSERWHRLVFRGWDERTGKETSPRELLRGERLVIMPDLDGSHLWLRVATDMDQAASPWLVVSALDGHLVARVPFVPGTVTATRVGDRAYLITSALTRAPLSAGPLQRLHTLRAIDLGDGKEAWARPVADHSGQRWRSK